MKIYANNTIKNDFNNDGSKTYKELDKLSPEWEEVVLEDYYRNDSKNIDEYIVYSTQVYNHIKVKYEGKPEIFYTVKNTEIMVGDENQKKYKIIYKINKWGTRGAKQFAKLKQANPKVEFEQRHNNYYDGKNGDSDTNSIFNLNFLENENLLFTKTPDGVKIKKELWGTNVEEIKNLNGVPVNTPWDYEDTLISTTPNKKYAILVSKASAIKKITGSGANIKTEEQNGSNNIIITYVSLEVPDFSNPTTQDGNDNQLGATQNVNLEDTNNTFFPTASGELIGSGYTDIPPSVFYTQAKAHDPNYREHIGIPIHTTRKKPNDGSDFINFNFVEIDCNTLIPIKIRDYASSPKKTQENGIMDIIQKLIQEITLPFNINNYSTILHPSILSEMINYDNNFVIKYDMSDINLSIPYAGIYNLTLGFNIAPAANFAMIGSFGDDLNPFKFTNRNNPNQNTSYTSKRVENSAKMGVIGSASEDYMDKNITAGFTTTTNNYLNDASDLLSTTSSLINHPSSILSPSFLLNTGKKLFNDYTTTKTLGNGVYGAPQNFVSSPFIGGYTKNEITDNTSIDINDIKLFSTYLLTYPDFVLEKILRDDLGWGKYTPIVDNFITYENRTLINIVKINTNYNTNEILEAIKLNGEDALGNQQDYQVEFLALLKNGFLLDRIEGDNGVVGDKILENTQINNIYNFKNKKLLSEIFVNTGANETLALDDNITSRITKQTKLFDKLKELNQNTAQDISDGLSSETATLFPSKINGTYDYLEIISDRNNPNYAGSIRINFRCYYFEFDINVVETATDFFTKIPIISPICTNLDLIDNVYQINNKAINSFFNVNELEVLVVKHDKTKPNPSEMRKDLCELVVKYYGNDITNQSTDGYNGIQTHDIYIYYPTTLKTSWRETSAGTHDFIKPHNNNHNDLSNYGFFYFAAGANNFNEFEFCGGAHKTDGDNFKNTWGIGGGDRGGIEVDNSETQDFNIKAIKEDTYYEKSNDYYMIIHNHFEDNIDTSTDLKEKQKIYTNAGVVGSSFDIIHGYTGISVVNNPNLATPYDDANYYNYDNNTTYDITITITNTSLYNAWGEEFIRITGDTTYKPEKIGIREL